MVGLLSVELRPNVNLPLIGIIFVELYKFTDSNMHCTLNNGTIGKIALRIEHGNLLYYHKSVHCMRNN